MEGGRGCHSWRKCVVVHGLGGLGGGRDGGGGRYACVVHELKRQVEVVALLPRVS